MRQISCQDRGASSRLDPGARGCHHAAGPRSAGRQAVGPEGDAPPLHHPTTAVEGGGS